MQVLSATGAIHEAPESIRSQVCFDGQILLVDQALRFDQVTGEYIEGLKRIKKLDFELLYVSEDEVTRALKKGKDAKQEINETDAEKLTFKLMDEGRLKGASDIHIGVDHVNGKTTIRMRIHGDLEEFPSRDDNYGVSIGRSLFLLIDNSGKVAHFDSKAGLSARVGNHPKLPKGLFGIRVENVPTNTGNNLVLRLLYDATGGDMSLTSLGFSEDHADVFKMFTKSTHGIVLFSGPTGSGKSTTLNRYLHKFNAYHKGKKSIYTIEDPVEMLIPGAAQTELPHCDTAEERSKEGVKLLNSALRADPDLIMVGEIRDESFTGLGLRASMTGHQVIGTVHANNAIGIMNRLIDMGAPGNIIYDPTVVIGLVSQRLLRVLCEHCKKPLSESIAEYPQNDIKRIMSTPVDMKKAYVRGCGCKHCDGRGVTGRTVVAQVIRTDQKLMDSLREHNTLAAQSHIKNEIKATSMIDNTITKINAGMVDPFDAESSVGLLNMDLIEDDGQIKMSEIRSTV